MLGKHHLEHSGLEHLEEGNVLFLSLQYYLIDNFMKQNTLMKDKDI